MSLMKIRPVSMPSFDFFQTGDEKAVFEKLKARGVPVQDGFILFAPVAASGLKTWPIEKFEQTLKARERFTFEYVMLDGVNDSDEHARQLANLLNRHKLHAKINLIPHNPADPLPYQPSPATRVEMFKSILESKGVRTFVRRPRGRDIFAACGQLAAVTQTVSLRI